MDASDLPPPGAAASPPPASLFDALPDALLRFDEVLRVVYVNAAFERAMLLGRRQLLGRRLDEVEAFAPYAALWQQALTDVLHTEEERWFKFGYEHPLGRRHFDVRLLLERTLGERHVTALLRDVTYTRGAVRASRGADAFADAMLSAVNVGVALFDRELRLRHINGFLEQLSGVSAENALGRRPDEIFDLSALPEVMTSYTRMRSGIARSTEQHEYVLPSSARPWVRERRTPIFDARGAFDGVLVLVERVEPTRFAETSLSALRAALEHAGELVLEIGIDGTVLDANDTALRLLGLTRADLGAISLLQIDSDLTNDEFAGLLERLRVYGAERRETRYMSRTRAGAALSVEVIAQRVEYGQREMIFLLARDIGERKSAELALLESAERFRSLFDESPVALLLLDENLRVLQANRAASRLLDCALIDLAGVEAATLLAPGDPQRMQQLRRDLAAEALHPGQADVQIRHADGQSVWARLVVRGWRAERSRRYLLVLEDITERKLAALQLEAAVAQQRTLLESMAAAVAQVRDGLIVQANGEFARLFGYAESMIAGMPLARLTEAGDSGLSPGPLPPVEAGRTSSAETMLVRADGRPLWCLVQARAVGAAAGMGAIYTFQDVTGQRADREVLARSLLELNLVFDSTEVALLHLADGRVIRCNAQAASMFGGADGPIGRPFAALVELSAENPLPGWLNVGAEAAELPAEARMRGADGSMFWALVSMRAIDPQRPAAGQIVTVLNIDERKRNEQEVQRMRNYLDLVVESLPVSIAVRDAQDGRFISLNRAGEALLGRPRDAVIGRTWQQLYPRALADELAAIDAQALQRGQMIDQPRAVSQSADGRPLTVHRRVLPIFEAAADGSEAPRPRYLMSIVDDLSATVRTEAALQDTEAHFRELAGHIDAFVFIADRNLATLTYVSPRCEALLGIPAARLQEDPRLALERVQAQERPLLARRMPFVLARLARLRRTALTVRIDHPTLGARSITVRFTPVRTPQGDLRIFGMAEDETEREAVHDRRLAAAMKSQDLQMHEVRQRLKKNLQGVAGLLQQQAFARAELAEPLTETASQIHAMGLVHGMSPADADGVPFVALVQGIFSSLSAVYNAIVQVEPPGYVLSRWLLTESEAVPMALVINELGGNAIRHRSKVDQRVVARMTARGERIELRIEQSGRLKDRFDLARIPAGVSGLGLAKALLPQRGARLRIEQLGPLVITRLELMPPAVRISAPPATQES